MSVAAEIFDDEIESLDEPTSEVTQVDLLTKEGHPPPKVARLAMIREGIRNVTTKETPEKGRFTLNVTGLTRDKVIALLTALNFVVAETIY